MAEGRWNVVLRANALSKRPTTCEPLPVYEMMRALAWVIARALMPYPDLVRRWRVRRAAFGLVSRGPFPADDLVSGTDIAELVLLRVLWLQRQTRRAVRSRQREAAVLLARSSMEAAILGVWCLRCPGAVESLRAAQLKSAGTSLVALIEMTDIFPKHLIEQAIRALGQPKQGRTVRDMAKAIDVATGGGIEAELYDRWYAPTSTYFVHANASSLSRHVGAKSKRTGRPSMPWTRRSPVRVTDACVGLVATAVAENAHKPSRLFTTYALGHSQRVLPPTAVLLAKGASRSANFSTMIRRWREAIGLQSYLAGPGREDAPSCREAQVRALFDFVFEDPDIPRGAFEPLVDHVVQKIIDEWSNQPDNTRVVAT